MNSFNGLGTNMGNLSRLSAAKTRSLSPENFTGEKNKGAMATEGTGKDCARDLGVGFKISPSIVIAPGEVRTIAEIDGPGAIQQIWLTPTGIFRFSILRIYWDGSEHPSVECPIGDFFAYAFDDGRYAPLSSLAVCVNPARAFNCYWEMPFRKHCKITLENIDVNEMVLYYQINYTLTDVPEDCAYFHAQFRRSNPLPYMEDYVLLDGVKGQGHYVGTYMYWGVNNNGWWGEGEIKFFMDGDKYPTICGTGTEDYFCGSYNFDVNGKYVEYCTPYAGLSKVSHPDGLYKSQQRFSMYRWHITDPIRFENDLRVTIQALGWRSGRRYLPLQDDISSVAFWYQTLPHAEFPKFPIKDELEII
ncbi:MAG: DUF2961 domain-containing protein [Defluviitaleaceae bacterium]|nr:DUF2961 domain-containing protein [Defluviitaleaceae bacterium]